MAITYAVESSLSAAECAHLLAATKMAAKRPLKNLARIDKMLRGANFVATARNETGLLVGVARCITDFEWICYCAELAVRESHQGQGIGRDLLEFTRRTLGPNLGLTLNAEPEAVAFYERLGMKPYRAFYMARERSD